VLSHKRVIETVGEKAQALAQASSYGGNDVLGTVESIGKRYEELVNNFLVGITMLEESLDAFTLFQDLQKAHQDYQKQLWDRLSVYSGKLKKNVLPTN
jgi:nesprin-1